MDRVEPKARPPRDSKNRKDRIGAESHSEIQDHRISLNIRSFWGFGDGLEPLMDPKNMLWRGWWFIYSHVESTYLPPLLDDDTHRQGIADYIMG